MCLIFGYMEQCPQSIQNSSCFKMYTCSSLSCGMDMSSVSVFSPLCYLWTPASRCPSSSHRHFSFSDWSTWALTGKGKEASSGQAAAASTFPSIPDSQLPVWPECPMAVAAWDLPPSGHAHHPAPAYVTYTHSHTCTNADFKRYFTGGV